MKKIYTAIDIGSDTIKFVVGEYFKNKLNILATYEQKSKGIRKGLIIDSNLMVNSIKDGIKVVSNDLGFQIKKVIVNVPSYNAKFMFVTSEIEITGDAITTDDVNNLIKASVYSKVEQDYELITVLPLTFLIDGEKETKVVGKTGNKLEIKGIMISAPKKNVYSVLSVMEGAGLEVVDITVSALGDYYEVRNDNLDKNIGAIINL